MGMFVEEKRFDQLATGDYIEFTNDISGNDEAGTVISVKPLYVIVQQWDKDLDGDVENGYGPFDISNITKIK